MTTIKIDGMKCQHCVSSVQKGLEALEGVTGVQVDLEAHEAHFEGEVDSQLVKAVIAEKGFSVVE